MRPSFRLAAPALALAPALLLALPQGAQALGLDYPTLTGEAPIVISHRGASGYLPEHTIEAYELAASMGVDYIEPDVQITKDGVLVAIHDATLNRTTNVEAVLGMRNGGYNVSDYTLAEIKQLTVDIVPNKTYPGFTSAYGAESKVPTLDEVLDFANQWNSDNGTSIGVYPEAKAASSELNAKIVTQLVSKGFSSTADNHVYIQSFSVNALTEIDTLLDEASADIDLISLGYVIAGGGWYGTDGTTDLATLVSQGIDGLGVYISSPGLSGDAAWIDFIEEAHGLGLSVVGWTFGTADDAAAAAQFADYIGYGMDGFFSNYPDQAISAVANAAVPVPAALGLLGMGVASLAGLRARRRTRATA